jgi:tetratricopeptide (TPR) repeat protein
MSQMAMDGMHAAEDRVTAEQEEFLKEFECIIKTNIATCHIKLKNALKALDSVREALAINPKAWKAMLRQAEATLLLHNAEKALKILNEAAQNAPADDEPAQTAINKMKEKANLALKKEEAQQKKSFNNIFDRARATAAPGENWDDRDPDR